MTHQLLNSVANENGGGLSVSVTGKYTSVRHERARLDGKLTAGEAAKIVSKNLAQKISAKELVAGFQLLYGRDPEWHHAGFYKNQSKKSTMGRTFFFQQDDIDSLSNDWSKIPEKKEAIEIEEKRKQETIVKGFFYSWDYDYNGSYGKKRNYKVLKIYEGPENATPNNFKPCSDAEFEKAKDKAGKKYFGWDEPTYLEFNI